LRAGDILLEVPPSGTPSGNEAGMLGLIASYWYHAGMFDGRGNILEAANPSEGIVCKPVGATGFASARDWVVLRVKENQQARVPGAISWAESKASNCPQDTSKSASATFMPSRKWLDAGNRFQDSEFYCSLFVWKAYQQQGLDLAADPGLLRLAFPTIKPGGVLAGLSAQVSPDELYSSAFVPFIGTTSVIMDGHPNTLRTLYSIMSPADLLVSDLNGNATGSTPSGSVNTLLDAFYSGLRTEPEWVRVPDIGGASRIELHGTASGDYSLFVEVLDGHQVLVQGVEGTASLGSTALYAISDPRSGSLTLTTDSTPPGPTSWLLSSAPSNPDGSYPASPTITLAASDPPFANGMPGAGVASMYFQVLAHPSKTPLAALPGNWTLYTGPFEVPASGQFDLYAFSVDAVGNAESPRFIGDLTIVDAGGSCSFGCPPGAGATPEMDSLTLFGSGLSGLAGYAYLRLRGRRSRPRWRV
jgi:hypothetical protein